MHCKVISAGIFKQYDAHSDSIGISIASCSDIGSDRPRDISITVQRAVTYDATPTSCRYLMIQCYINMSTAGSTHAHLKL